MEMGGDKGVNGYFVEGKNGNSIFLPMAGFAHGGMYSGFYWSSSLNEDKSNYAWSVYFDSDLVNNRFQQSRFCGLSVRPVLGSE